ncbi:hypothetical protein TSH20_24700 [Azospirillum sp. TSH20]|nr:hypothetical protein TSH20_24700 [Azospirillum sp. TSH20]
MLVVQFRQQLGTGAFEQGGAGGGPAAITAMGLQQQAEQFGIEQPGVQVARPGSGDESPGPGVVQPRCRDEDGILEPERQQLQDHRLPAELRQHAGIAAAVPVGGATGQPDLRDAEFLQLAEDVIHHAAPAAGARPVLVKTVQVQRSALHRRCRPAQEAADRHHLRIRLTRRGPFELGGLVEPRLAQQHDEAVVQEVREHPLARLAVFGCGQNLPEAARHEDRTLPR